MCNDIFNSKQAFESTLKSWEDKQKCDSCKPVLRSPLYPQQAVELATEEEALQIQLYSQAAEELITRYWGKNRGKKFYYFVLVQNIYASYTLIKLMFAGWG